MPLRPNSWRPAEAVRVDGSTRSAAQHLVIDCDRFFGAFELTESGAFVEERPGDVLGRIPADLRGEASHNLVVGRNSFFKTIKDVER